MKRFLAALVLVIGCLLLTFKGGWAAITLAEFSVIPGNGRVEVRWRTGTQLNFSGFYVQRSSQPDSGFTRLQAEMIFASGDPLLSQTYQFIDTSVLDGMSYWYRVEAIDTNGRSDFSEVKGVIPGPPTATPTPTSTTAVPVAQAITDTPTPTPTFTPTFTTTPTQVLPPSPTATWTPLPTATGAPLPTPTALVFATFTPEGAVASPVPAGPTATLIPFPTITVRFSPTERTAQLLTAEQEQDTFFPKAGSSLELPDFGRLAPVLIVAFLWLVVAGLFFYFRRFVV